VENYIKDTCYSFKRAAKFKTEPRVTNVIYTIKNKETHNIDYILLLIKELVPGDSYVSYTLYDLHWREVNLRNVWQGCDFDKPPLLDVIELVERIKTHEDEYY
jgi:hypothetical protein